MAPTIDDAHDGSRGRAEDGAIAGTLLSRPCHYTGGVVGWILIGLGYLGLIGFLRWMGAYSERRRAEIRREHSSLRR